MLAHELVAKIFRMEGLEFVGDGGAFHKEHAAADLQRICDSRTSPSRRVIPKAQAQ